MKQVEESSSAYGSRARRGSIVVDEDGKRYTFLRDEILGVMDVACTDDGEAATATADVVVSAAQLRRVRPAVQSAEVPREDEDERIVCPQVADTTQGAIGVRQLDPFQCLDVHPAPPCQRQCLRVNRHFWP